MNASVILMDEPFGALDRKIRWEMQDLIAEIAFFNPEREYTFMIVTHDIPEAVFLGDRIWIINKGGIAEQMNLQRPNKPARVSQGDKDFNAVVSFFNEKIDSLEIKN